MVGKEKIMKTYDYDVGKSKHNAHLPSQTFSLITPSDATTPSKLFSFLASSTNISGIYTDLRVPGPNGFNRFGWDSVQPSTLEMKPNMWRKYLGIDFYFGSSPRTQDCSATTLQMFGLKWCKVMKPTVSCWSSFHSPQQFPSKRNQKNCLSCFLLFPLDDFTCWFDILPKQLLTCTIKTKCMQEKHIRQRTHIWNTISPPQNPSIYLPLAIESWVRVAG